MVERKPEQPHDTPKPRFSLGQILTTPGALEALNQTNQEAVILLARHVTGDWGDLVEEDKQENEYSVDKELRIFSAYSLENGVKVWIITEADRSATTILLPGEY